MVLVKKSNAVQQMKKHEFSVLLFVYWMLGWKRTDNTSNNKICRLQHNTHKNT